MTTFLAQKNAHPRDARIRFEEADHLYFVEGDDADYTSVTTLIHSFFQTFDADKVIDKMMRAKTWPQSKYHGMTRDEIKEGWETNRDSAATAGTKMHYIIECFYNGDTALLDADMETRELQHFRKYLADHPFEPYRTEWVVYDEEAKVAGSIDMVYVDPADPTGETLMIYDWKRSKEIRLMNPYQSGTGPLACLNDCNYVHYSMQLNTYKHILETKCGKKVSRLRLVVLHPDNDTYRIVAVPDMQPYVRTVWEARRASPTAPAPH